MPTSYVRGGLRTHVKYAYLRKQFQELVLGSASFRLEVTHRLSNIQNFNIVSYTVFFFSP